MKYPTNGTFADIIEYTMRAKRFEPVSVKGNVVRRNVGHRFAINVKGAKSSYEVMAENIESTNALFRALTKK